MTTTASAVILAPSGPRFLIAGLPPTERTRRALQQCGIALGDRPEAPVTLLVAGDALVEPSAITALLAAAGTGTAALATGDDPRRPAALAVATADLPPHFNLDEGALAELASSLRAAGCLRAVYVGEALCVRVGDPAIAERAGARLVGRLIRPTDGFFARHFDRHVSRAISVRLVARDVSPNTVTAVATAVGLAGAILLASMRPSLRVLGAALFVCSTILDGCDGEVARLAFRCSEFGRRFDLIGDNAVNAAIFLALGVAVAHGADGGVPRELVYATLVGFVLATATGFFFSNWLARVGMTVNRDWYERLTGRDFAYVILALAAIGRLPWFLWMAAVGCFVFSAVILAYWASLTRAPAAPRKATVLKSRPDAGVAP